MYALLSILAFASAGLLGPSAPHRGDPVEIPLSEVPELVRKAADKTAPQARWKEAAREERDGKTLYALDGEDDRGRGVGVILTGEGKLDRLLLELSDTEVPDVVKRALKREAPKFQAEGYAKVIRDGGSFEYMAVGQEDGEDLMRGIDPDGKKVRVVPDDEGAL